MFEAAGESIPVPAGGVHWSPITTGGTSWLALVATTLLGSGQMSRSRLSVQADVAGGDARGQRPGARFRLVVQSYAPGVLDDLGMPLADARPLGSTQRFVDAEELRRGVSVDLVQLEDAAQATLIAWLEWDEADLEFDALSARPTPDAWLGHAPADDAGCRLTLYRRTH
jgi:aryl carrier-like protein